MTELIFGTETELMVAAGELDDDLTFARRDVLSGLTDIIADLFAARVSQRHRVQLLNGASVYIDGQGLEYATPPCGHWAEVALHELDMETILMEAVAEYRANWGDSLVVLRPGAGAPRDSLGYHENYGLPHRLYFNLFDPSNFQPTRVWRTAIIPFLVTRIIFVGSGGVYGDKLVMSPRASQITHVFHRSTSPQRPIVHLKRPRLQDRFLRIHITCGDAGQMLWATKTKLVTTGAVLLAAARGQLDSVDFELRDAAGSMRELSRSQDPELRLQLANGGVVSALDILDEIGSTALAARSAWVSDQGQGTLGDVMDVFRSWQVRG